jgi:hypothetical protein
MRIFNEFNVSSLPPTPNDPEMESTPGRTTVSYTRLQPKIGDCFLPVAVLGGDW